MKIRTAILGYGRSGSTMHAGAIENNDSFELTAVCDIDPERLDQASQRFSCRTYTDYHTMLDTEQLDLVCIITRSDQHCQMTCDCLAAGVNVLVTKPWAVNSSEAESMIAAAKKSGRKLLPWLPARWGCDLQRLKELIANGAIGNVFLIRRVVSSFGTRDDWQTQRIYGGGYLLNWGAHIVDPPVLLAGSSVKTVYGVMKQTINPGDVEDVFMSIITMDNGTTVQAEYTVSLDEHPSWVVQGDRGTIVVRGNSFQIYSSSLAHASDPTLYSSMNPDDITLTEEIVPGAVYGDENEIYTQIAAAIRDEQDFPVTPNDALELTRVFDAIRLSSETNTVVAL